MGRASVMIELVLALGCGLSAFTVAAAVDGVSAPHIVSALIWEATGAFLMLFLVDLRSGRGSRIAWIMVLSITTTIIIVALYLDPLVLAILGVLVGRHYVLVRTGWIRSAFADVVHFVFAIFPAGLVAQLARSYLGLGVDAFVLLLAGVYFGFRFFFKTTWDPHQWLGVDWLPRSD